MKPAEGRQRVVIEEIQPQVNCGRYSARRFLGDQVEVTAAIFSDGHDHVAAQLLYKRENEHDWRVTPMTALVNDMWTASFTADALGPWRFTVRAWVDHFDTWCSDLRKRLDAQSGATPSRDPAVSTAASPDAANPGSPVANASAVQLDIPVALTIGSNMLDQIAARATGEDVKTLKTAARNLRTLVEQKLPFYEDPITPELEALAARYPDLSFASLAGREYPLWIDRERARFSSWYEVFPRSTSPDAARHGTLADVAALVPEIAGMGFSILYLPPIHPIGRAFRKGKNNSVTAAPDEEGSPWAIGDAKAGVPGGGGHKSIHPKLGTYADFDALVATLRENGMELAMDIAFQCSPDHPWVTEHPEWFIHRPDGTIQYAENPPKKYQDIYPLNFESSDWQGLWEELRSVFQFWIDRGVKVFRVDNPHTKALPFWEWCIAELRAAAPDAIFLAEAFTRPHVMYSLAKGGFTQSYTYFTWRTEKPEIQAYFEEITRPPVSDFFTPNVWPNTPDILHASLQQGGRAAFMSRLILATTLASSYGIYGPAYELGENVPVKEGSEEYLNSEKYEQRHWNRRAPQSLAPLVALLNKIRNENPALQSDRSLHFHTVDNPWIVCYSKTTIPPPAPMTLEEANALSGGGHGAHRGVAPPSGPSASQRTSAAPPNVILVAVNLDPQNDQAGWVDLDLDLLGLGPDETYDVEDLLTGAHYQWRGRSNYVALHPSAIPAHVLRVTRR
ncbi:MAG TPA: alpha-1,4-glucan--maltose-1-phosphate maltosyltransferase [Acidobacteriaceae bacterium]|nr:alpha-1,4-glucan--maltose-1-phosphate maltosyltransferase [Acidobacteriaceae bacterium]